jgi:hypothetical protein
MSSREPLPSERRASAECAGPGVLAAHLGALAQNCNHRNPSEDPKVRALAAHRMVVMLSEFSSRVALAAIDRWPQEADGKWFPTEGELRALCVRIQQSRREPSAAPPAVTEKHSPEHRSHMKQLIRGLAAAVTVNNGGRAPKDLSPISKAEMELNLARFRRDRAELERAAAAKGFRTVNELMANKRLP